MRSSIHGRAVDRHRFWRRADRIARSPAGPRPPPPTQRTTRAVDIQWRSGLTADGSKRGAARWARQASPCPAARPARRRVPLVPVRTAGGRGRTLRGVSAEKLPRYVRPNFYAIILGFKAQGLILRRPRRRTRPIARGDQALANRFRRPRRVTVVSAPWLSSEPRTHRTPTWSSRCSLSTASGCPSGSCTPRAAPRRRRRPARNPAPRCPGLRGVAHAAGLPSDDVPERRRLRGADRRGGDPDQLAVHASPAAVPRAGARRLPAE